MHGHPSDQPDPQRNGDPRASRGGRPGLRHDGRSGHGGGLCRVQGQTYYFCAKGCRDAFVADPEKYLANGPEGMADQEDEGQRDPVCGMTVEPESAAGHVEHEGKTYYFCSRSCVEKFKANPEKYLAEGQEEPAAGSARGRRLRLPDVPGGPPGQARGMPVVRDGAGGRGADVRRWQGRVHLPDAPGDRAG